ncbi:hypothetical protein MLD38_019112 [Melastoma candidum]|uniref:Uncharacterized protein n=1 Tax=Melastoma candidum TaxID=119954 RepID=A0ACB9QX98_9MYRT|nr:hypothetical protein MLD38_019112 [Melastoma candidum]
MPGSGLGFEVPGLDSRHGPVVGIEGDEGLVGPLLVNVVDDDEGLGDSFPWCTSTGTFLWTGLYLSKRGLLFSRSSSRYTYSTPFNARTIRMRRTKGLPQTSNNMRSSSIVLACPFLSLDCFCVGSWNNDPVLFI